MRQRYYAAVPSAGSPASIAQLINMYAYLQCYCGHPPSPHVKACPRLTA
jgi:hypothetical protein